MQSWGTQNKKNANRMSSLIVMYNLVKMPCKIFVQCAAKLQSHNNMELTGIEPATFRMQSGRSITELQPLGCDVGPKYNLY